MRRAGAKFIFTVFVAVVFASIRPPPVNASSQKAEEACAVSIRVPASDDVYKTLAILKYRKLHLTCPVNVRNEHVAKIVILNGADLCERQNLYGYPVISRKPLSNSQAKKLYAECSRTNVWDGNKFEPAKTDVYIWYYADRNVTVRAHEMESLFGKVAGRLASSGLPVFNFLDTDDMFCFEVDTGYDRDMISSIRDLGIPVPSLVRQIKHANTTCMKMFMPKNTAGKEHH